ncbi:MAG: NUDIX domain-containing protein [Planctomycetes bacterium]|nr:NUDIX domain-containing protein [Planctomycetota bacterium]
MSSGLPIFADPLRMKQRTEAVNGPTRGVVAVLRDDEKYLMIRRAEGEVAPGWWCFPGGAIEDGETEEQALVREVREEVGLDVRPIERIWTWNRDDGLLVLTWWRSELLGGVLLPNPDEVAEARWMTPSQIESLPKVLASNREFLRLHQRNP